MKPFCRRSFVYIYWKLFVWLCNFYCVQSLSYVITHILRATWIKGRIWSCVFICILTVALLLFFLEIRYNALLIHYTNSIMKHIKIKCTDLYGYVRKMYGFERILSTDRIFKLLIFIFVKRGTIAND